MFVADPHTPAVRAAIAGGDSLAVSDVTVAEFAAVAAAMRRNRTLDAATWQAIVAVAEDWVTTSTVLVPLAPGDMASCTRLLNGAEIPLRMPDALHIVICRRLGATLLSFDVRQTAAAAAIGLAVAA
ncbi:hypothetical protein IP88_02195 [alpha proteobacterium AAP81b]|nr:hypothetical protein IP88_02195 [alpha proteobacterium AAP81b]